MEREHTRNGTVSWGRVGQDYRIVAIPHGGQRSLTIFWPGNLGEGIYIAKKWLSPWLRDTVKAYLDSHAIRFTTL